MIVINTKRNKYIVITNLCQLVVFSVGNKPSLFSIGDCINNLLPGAFDTARLQATLEASAHISDRTVEQVKQQLIARNPAGRFGRPEEFGAMCGFLCSTHAGYITGQNILMDGGAYPGTF